MNKTLVVDIETIANRELPQEYKDYYYEMKKDKKITVDKLKMKKNREKIESEYALHPQTGKLLIIGYLIYDGEKAKIEQETLIECTEEQMLIRFWNMVHQLVILNGYKLITKYGKLFDIPFLFFRSLYYPLSIVGTPYYSKLISPYNTDYHVDLQNFMPGKLGELSYLLLGNPLDTDTGDMIAEMYAKGEWNRIKEKNRVDITTTFQIYQRMSKFIM